jgi:hypothetical protein
MDAVPLLVRLPCVKERWLLWTSLCRAALGRLRIVADASNAISRFRS